MPRADQTPPLKVKQNAGTPDQLPQGAAQDINQGYSDVPDNQPEVQVEPQEARFQDFNPSYEPVDENDAFITGPSTRPDEAVTVGTERQARVPDNVRAALPWLQRAAAEPGAAPQLQSMLKLILREVDS